MNEKRDELVGFTLTEGESNKGDAEKEWFEAKKKCKFLEKSERRWVYGGQRC